MVRSSLLVLLLLTGCVEAVSGGLGGVASLIEAANTSCPPLPANGYGRYDARRCAVSPVP